MKNKHTLHDMEDFTKFNINSKIKVKLNDKGYDILASNHNSYAENLPSLNIRTAKSFREEADSYGYTVMVCWDFMSIFGEYLYNGCNMPFDTNILLYKSDCKDYEDNFI